jgi:hypothetical protein
MQGQEQRQKLGVKVCPFPPIRDETAMDGAPDPLGLSLGEQATATATAGDGEWKGEAIGCLRAVSGAMVRLKVDGTR